MFPRLWDFEGSWRLTRDISHADGATAQFAGRAEFLRDGPGLIYREQGMLTLGTGDAMRAERTYLWRKGTNGGLDVRFDDDRPFHQITQNAETAQHWCDPDTYDVAYGFTDWPNWDSTWLVKGPRKAYCMTSRYHRYTS